MAADAPAARKGPSPLLIAYYLLAGSVALLLILGLVMVFSSSAVTEIARTGDPWSSFLKQVVFAAVGLLALAVMMRIPGRVWRMVAWPALGGAMVLQLLVFTPIGVNTGGNRNWVRVGGQLLQPSEFLKLALVLWLAAVLAVKRPVLDKPAHILIPVVPVSGLAIGLVMLGHDLGTALVMFMLVCGALFIAGVPARWFAFVAGLAVLAVVALSQTSNRLSRIAAWQSSTACTEDPDRCYQAEHGTFALGSGGLFGIGLGNSREKWSYLPAAHNDFIYAVIGEELGLLGTALVLVLFGLLAFSLLQVVRHHPDPLAQIAAGTLACWIVGQAAINIAVVTGLVPVIGLPLPLVSAGGSSLIAVLASIGLMLSLIRSDEQVAFALKARRSWAARAVSVMGAPRRRKATRDAGARPATGRVSGTAQEARS